MDKVSVICPTYDRHGYHGKLYTAFATQTYENRELIVLDDSPIVSPLFTNLKDPRVKYLHQSERMTVGEKRNRLIELSSGDIIAHFDDDDYYAPTYLAKMLQDLGKADLIKFSKWLAWREVDGSLWEVDSRSVADGHFVVDGNTEVRFYDNFISKLPNADLFVEHTLWGYGFSYVYRKLLWRHNPFDHVNFGEDYDFVFRARQSGGVALHQPDAEHLLLHTLHPKSSSKIFPQRHLDATTALALLGEGVAPWLVVEND